MTGQQLLFVLAAVAGLNLVLVRQSGKSATDAIEALIKELRTQREDAARVLLACEKTKKSQGPGTAALETGVSSNPFNSSWTFDLLRLE